MEAKKNNFICELETRNYRRVETQHQARFILKVDNSNWKECIIININNNLKGLGIRFKAQEEIEVDSLVIIDLLRTDDLEPIYIEGTIRWVKEMENNFFAGIELTKNIEKLKGLLSETRIMSK